ncbi:MAG: Lrp/AsnC family transcriptional regulator [Clostridiales bacterium]|nr:Lrp/AsnC family transcriptional regulator [Clostridiales bacterium]
MDEIDRKILHILCENARISLKELGGMINLSNTATGERVKKLEDTDIIKRYTIIMDHKKIGYSLHVMIVLEFPYTVRENQDKFLRFIKDDKRIVCAYPAYSGGKDYVLDIYCKDMQAFIELQDVLVGFGFATSFVVGDDILEEHAT